MTFSVALPQTGLQGWLFLSRTIDTQKHAYFANGEAERNILEFQEKISEVHTAEQLVADRELLSVALTAFGLEDDIDNKFLIRKILNDGSSDPDALANRFSDKRYLAFTKAFGFGDFDVPRTQLSYFSEEILSLYKDRQFEVSVGEQDQDMRLALSFGREMENITETDKGEDTKWLEVLGNPPLKSIVERSMFLPDGFDSLDLDDQVALLKERTEMQYGSSSVDVFRDQKNIDKMRTRFLLATQLERYQYTNGASTALTLLQGGATA
ncbi:MAG: DUF1217 domain-containing protein [Litoreibacter sp.]|uniref:DUF1217 domain-containing protein n=1 Tax=Litoreibacter sp. TaxID=1969459 RepID=UPI0032982CDC